jgi:FAD/FMN-containing dehydrogenase
MLLAWFGTLTSPHSAVVLFPIDGAVNRLPASHSAAGNRDARLVINITSAWERAEDDAAMIGWARDAWHDVRPLSTGGTYVNFLTQEEGDDRIRAAYGANYARLAAVKAAWDPDNVFNANKNIVPHASR